MCILELPKMAITSTINVKAQTKNQLVHQQKAVKRDDKHRNSPPKTRSPSPKTYKKSPTESTSATHFCSSVFLNSPDPSALPMPIFDDDEEIVVNSKTSTANLNVVTKTNTLRQFLNIHPALSTPIAV